MPRTTLGNPADVNAVIIGLINSTHEELDREIVLDGEQEPRPFGELNVDPWHLRFWGRRSVSPQKGWWEPLARSGSYVFTHAVEIRRGDGTDFDATEIDSLRDALFHVLSFAKGRLVGLALPIAYNDDGEPVWIRWETTVVDPWTIPLTWFARSLFPGLGGLIGRYVELADDEFWRLVLRRAVRMTVSANTPDPLDVAIPTAVAVLELLGWAVESVGWAPSLGSGPQVVAAERIRGLLQWADIPAAVPEELTRLAERSERHDVADAPSVLAGIRNRLMHPPRTPREQDWPDGELLREAWRITLELAELCLLRLLDYSGNYAHRRHLRGRWDGATDPVPWRV